MTLYLKTFNLEQMYNKKKPKKFAFSVFMGVSLSSILFYFSFFCNIYKLMWLCYLVAFYSFHLQTQLAMDPDLFDHKKCEREFRRACKSNQISKSDLVSFLFDPYDIFSLYFLNPVFQHLVVLCSIAALLYCCSE